MSFHLCIQRVNTIIIYLLIGDKMGKAVVFWLTEETKQKLEKVTEYIKSRKIELPNIAIVPELKGKLNRSMVLRYCIEKTLEVLEDEKK